MESTKFKQMTKKERANTYGGFNLLPFLPFASTLIQTVVSSGIAIYHAITGNSGSVSFAGSKTITEKHTAATHAAPPTTKTSNKTDTVVHSHAVSRSFSAY